MAKVITFRPVRLSHTVLQETLHDWMSLENDGLELEHWYYDDNDDAAASELMAAFASHCKYPVRRLRNLELGTDVYNGVRRSTHVWSSALIDRVIQIKNLAIREFCDTDADALFLIDADISPHPATVKHLLSLDLPIVAEVFWTRFHVDAPFMPNVWDYDGNSLYSANSIVRLRERGQYEVGGLGACTLVRREPLERGVSFARIPNLALFGEDRHFCVRAVCLGYPLIVDTTFPAFHVYREPLLSDLQRWRKQGYSPSFFDQWLDSQWEHRVARYIMPDHQCSLARRTWRAIRQAWMAVRMDTSRNLRQAPADLWS